MNQHTLIPMEGRRFGKLVVLHYSHSERGKRRYLCKCDCGRAKIMAGVDLRKGASRSCGCSNQRRIEMEPEARERYLRQYARNRARKRGEPVPPPPPKALKPEEQPYSNMKVFT